MPSLFPEVDADDRIRAIECAKQGNNGLAASPRLSQVNRMHSLARGAWTCALVLNLVACVSGDGQSGTDAIDVDMNPTASATQPDAPDDGADDTGDAGAGDDTNQTPDDDDSADETTPSDDEVAPPDDPTDETTPDDDPTDETAPDDDPTDETTPDDGDGGRDDSTSDEMAYFEPGTTLQLILEFTPMQAQTTIDRIGDAWFINVDLEFGIDGVTAYLAMTGTRYDDTTLRGTDGSRFDAGFHAETIGSRLEFEPCSVFDRGMISFESLNLDFSGATITGDARGNWESMSGGDYIDLTDFTASVVAVLDEQAPAAQLTSSTTLLPFDPITVNLSEPVTTEGFAVSVSAGEVLEADVVPDFDMREGFVTGFSLSMASGWPPGKTVSVRLDHATDAAGNESTNLDVASVAIEPAPDSMSNLGFELGAEGWLYVVAAEQVELENHQDSSIVVDPVLPPEGATMALITQRATGYLVAPDGATELCFTAGVHAYDLDASSQYGGGFDVELTSPGAHSLENVLASSFEPFANVDAGWSGFMDHCFGLPPDAQQGTWLNITPTGYAPPIAFPPDVVLDALRFQ